MAYVHFFVWTRGRRSSSSIEGVACFPSFISNICALQAPSVGSKPWQHLGFKFSTSHWARGAAGQSSAKTTWSRPAQMSAGTSKSSVTQILLNNSLQAPSVFNLTHIFGTEYSRRWIMATGKCSGIALPWASRAGSQLSSNPSLEEIPQPHLLKSGPLETRNKSRESSRQNFRAWKSHRANQSWSLLDHFQCCRVMEWVWTLQGVQFSWQNFPVWLPCILWEAGKVSGNSRQRTKFFVFVDLLQ